MIRQVVGVAALIALLGAVGFSRAAQSEPSAQEGQELFRKKCGICHLTGGTGTFMLSRRLGPQGALLEERDNLTAEYIRTVVRHGLMSMPRFTRVELDDEELQKVAAYLTAPKSERLQRDGRP